MKLPILSQPCIIQQKLLLRFCVQGDPSCSSKPIVDIDVKVKLMSTIGFDERDGSPCISCFHLTASRFSHNLLQMIMHFTVNTYHRGGGRKTRKNGGCGGARDEVPDPVCERGGSREATRRGQGHGQGA